MKPKQTKHDKERSELNQQDKAHLEVENIGGIAESEIDLASGVNILVGRNATNRTSHLQAIMAALGSDNVSLKSDADEGQAKLAIGGQKFTRKISRQHSSVQFSGNPLLDNSEIADLFAFLLESNRARRAVTRSEDLRELIMRPVDTEAIEAEIEQSKSRRRELDDQLDQLDSMKKRLPNLESESTRLEQQIEEKKQERDNLREKIEEADSEIEESQQEKAELEEKLDELKETRSTLENVQFRIQTEKDSLDSLHEEKSELKDELESLPVSVKEIGKIGTKIESLQERKSDLDSNIDQLNNILQFNKKILDEEEGMIHNLIKESEDDADDSPLTDQLLPQEQSVVCWTCGSDVERNQIESTLDKLRSVSTDMIEMRRSVKSELDDLREERNQIEQKQHRRDQIEHKLQQIQLEIKQREEDLDELKERRDPLKEDIKRLEAEVEDMEEADYSEILDLHKQANTVEFEFEQLREDFQDAQDEIESIEDQLDEYENIEQEREEIQERLENLRTKIDRIEEDAVVKFNEHMDNMLALLEYKNIERIWIERKQRQVSEGRRKVTRNVFDLHVTRSNESGVAYSDTIDHLSESEREVTGLVFGLAGYLVHDLHEVVPFMLLDSLEALDSERIAMLIEYFKKFAEYIVAALLPEDAAALDDEYYRITNTA